jgi:hypothetical protein
MWKREKERKIYMPSHTSGETAPVPLVARPNAFDRPQTVAQRMKKTL